MTHVKQINVNTDFTPFTKMNSQWVVDLKMKPKHPINPPKDNRGENLVDWGHGDALLDMISKIPSIKELIGYLDSIKITNFYSANDSSRRIRR